jgi:hypothetical protein
MAPDPLAQLRNPFLHETVADPWQQIEADVEEVNAPQYRQCVSLIEQTRATARSTSLLLHGPTGAGKTHLMSRLRKHVEQTEDGASPAYFVSVRLDTAPGRLWRHILRNLGGDLLRPRKDHLSRLDVLLDTALSKTGLDSLATRHGLSRALSTVLGAYHGRRHRAICAAWLKGESLNETELQVLGLPLVDEDDDDVEDRARQIVIQIAALTAPSVLVFCFDQIEALETHDGGLARFGNVVWTLHSHLTNALIILSVQSGFLTMLSNAVGSANLDRMREHLSTLNPLNKLQGRQVLLNRLGLVKEIAQLRPRTASPLWPLAENEIDKLFERENGSCPARRLIHRAKELFENARGGAPVEAVDFTLREHFQRHAASHALGDLDDDILQGLAVAATILGFGPASAPEGGLVDLRFGGVQFVLCNQNSQSLWRKLKRLAEKLPPEGQSRLRLLRDARLGIGQAAHITRQHLGALEAAGARLIQLAPEALAALRALRKLDADALAQGGVREWIRTYVPETLGAVLADLMPEAAVTATREAPADIDTPLWRYLENNPIAPVDEIAQATGLSAEWILSHARNHSNEIGLLAGPPAVLFRAATRAAAGAS